MSAVAERTGKRSWTQEVTRILAKVFEDHPEEEMTVGDVCRYALASKRIPPEFIEGIHEKAFRREIGRLLRTARLHTASGVDARQFQSYARLTTDDDGNEVQQHFWKDIRHMNRREMMDAAAARSSHIHDAKEALLADVEYWNENVRKPGERKIQLSLAL